MSQFEPDRHGAKTHQVENQPPPLLDYNSYTMDRALSEAVEREGAAAQIDSLKAFGELTGSAKVIEWGEQANANPPQLFTHDRYGNRIDEVRFHPSYHQLMAMSIEHGLHASHWLAPGPGAQVARAARFYLQTQVEASHLCPVCMTSAVIPALARQPEVAAQWAPRIQSLAYDPGNRQSTDKSGLTIGMAMTEKQGGSDVQANSTRAYPLGAGGPGQAYELVGHKYFVSAPMSDAFMVLAQAPGGLSCFLLPRWRPDGSRNPIQIQRLKPKMGNVANASCETELRGAWAQMIGDEGRGVATILQMVSMTRFDCMIGSSAGMRQAVVQALHHAHHRRAFGNRLVEQPLMQNVLADLVVEQEAALMLTMRIARALDASADDSSERDLVRIGTALGKYWICKRTPGHAYEAMECIGGSGVMEDTPMPRLYREAPVNAIWEGSGNVQCLDLLRVLANKPHTLETLLREIDQAAGIDPQLDRFVADLTLELGDQHELEYRSRALVERLALALQGSLLVRFGDATISDAFCRSRLANGSSGYLYGNLPRGIDCSAIIARAWPGFIAA
ncbi:DNA alkylation response protein [Motiliproteus coralliicola]|uniref:DNA alkylation response protein n=1 Tax=Motiliproteus coralliicola TaxID=2283196 RepID=A0A369WS40_9GAMM|nr:acyl-CoA dehydrogenase family protein [Motiliproteus coralliicola]RDE24361.1 DNA alkylation response protein [Motiliproteus coralliicola]